MPTEDEIYNEVSDDGIELETIITTLSKFNNENIVIKDNSNNV